MSFLSPPGSIVVKVWFAEEGISKGFALDPTQKISDVRNHIIQKRQDTNPIQLGLGEQLSNYGLFSPPSQHASGQWMKETDTLNDYNVSRSATIEFKLKPQPITIRAGDSGEEMMVGHTTIETDFTVALESLMPKFEGLLRLPNPGPGSDYVLETMTNVLLNPKQTLKQQSVPFGSTLTIKKHSKLLAKTTDVSRKTLNYSDFEMRIRSFAAGWPHKDIDYKPIAEAGFYFAPTPDRPDRGKCYACQLMFSNWQLEDDPRVEHRRFNPGCREVKKWKKVNVNKARPEAKIHVETNDGKAQPQQYQTIPKELQVPLQPSSSKEVLPSLGSSKDHTDYGPVPVNSSSEDTQDSEYAEVPLNVRIEDLNSPKTTDPSKKTNKYIKVLPMLTETENKRESQLVVEVPRKLVAQDSSDSRKTKLLPKSAMPPTKAQPPIPENNNSTANNTNPNTTSIVKPKGIATPILAASQLQLPHPSSPTPPHHQNHGIANSLNTTTNSKPTAPPRPHGANTSATQLPILIPQVNTNVTMPSTHSELSLEDQLNLLRSMYEEEREERIKLLNIVRSLQKRVEELTANK